MAVRTLLLLLLFLTAVYCWIVDPGPVVVATRGEVWPKPQQENKLNKFYMLDITSFKLNIIPENCSILQEAVSRYNDIISGQAKIAETYDTEYKDNREENKKYIGKLQSLQITLSGKCTDNQYPELDMNESYELEIPKNLNDVPELKAESVWGILRGLETFSQCLYTYDDDKNLYINATTIKDYPRFSHRGLLIDTARHYLPLDIIYKNLDAMAYNKMNVFHWHIIDDQSFPYQSETFPELSKKGAYNRIHQIYTQDDVKNIIEYARLRGIRVIPEFDTPGHTRSWGESFPELLSTCYKGGHPTGQYGPIDPSNEYVYSFIDSLFSEIRNKFQDTYLHLGGDEVNFDCWKNNKQIMDFMSSLDIKDNYKALQSYYMEKLFEITTPKGIKPIVWEEVFLAGTKLPSDAIVEVWLRDNLLESAINKGFRVILSSCWYLDHLESGGDWAKFYKCDPENYIDNKDQLKFLVGGEACMWAESVNSQNVLQRTWPRASATAEKLWSKHNADQEKGAAHRLEEHSCRMNRRNIPAQPPNGAGYCLT